MLSWQWHLLGAPLDFDAFRDRLIANRDPGLIFEAPNRVLVVEEHSGELRFYAGGWGAEPGAPAPARHSTVGSGFVDVEAKGNADPALACSP